MAIDFTSIKIHSRGKGNSAVAASAYRSASKMYDERTGEIHDYTKKNSVIYSSVLLPAGADEKFKNREYLWNEVEKAEKKINARVSKDIVIALPKELNEEEWKELSERFTEEHYTSKGIAADISIHNNEGNPHCHILVTTRRLLGNKFDLHKARDLDGEIRNSQYGNFSAVNNTLSGSWRELQNRYFEENNIDITVDQNYLISQLHEGKVTSEEVQYLKEINREKLIQSKNIALTDPALTLTILSRRNTVFSIKDIESLAYKHSDSKEQYEEIKKSIISHKDSISLGTGLDGKEHFTTAYAVKKEYKLINDVKLLKQQDNHRINEKKADRILRKYSLKEEQKNAVKHLLHSNDIAAVIGKPGTGKSYMLNAARDVWVSSGYNVLGTALSGIAAYGLKESSGINSKTLQSMLFALDKRNLKLGNKDIIVVDESGMIDTYQMSKLINYVKCSDAKIVLTGDPEQLQPIGPGAPLRAVLENSGYVEMSDIMRQKEQWQRDATLLLSKGDITGIDKYKEHGKYNYYETSGDAVLNIVNDWNKQTRPENLLDSVMIAHRNIDVDNLNSAARKALERRGIIDKNNSVEFNTNKGIIEISKGEKILFTKNDNSLNVRNGTFGTVKEVNKETGAVKTEIRDGDSIRTVEFSSDNFDNISYGYAATVHKLQGATVDSAYLYIGGKFWNRNLTLVAASRHRKDLFIYADKETYSSYENLKKVLSRENIKDSVLNYPVSFSLRRGFDPDSVIGRAVDKLAAKTEKIADKWFYLINKQHYIERMQQREKELLLRQNIKEALIVGKFTDLRKDLYNFRMNMQSELDGNRLYTHKDYDHYYRKQITFNKLGNYLYSNYERFETVCQANGYVLGDFKRYHDAG
jgi:Ti-type conjugative transfer relaxase TraA